MKDMKLQYSSVSSKYVVYRTCMHGKANYCGITAVIL